MLSSTLARNLWTESPFFICGEEGEEGGSEGGRGGGSEGGRGGGSEGGGGGGWSEGEEGEGVRE